MVVSTPGSATSLYPALQYSSLMSTLNSKADVTPAMSMLQEESDLQSMGTPSDHDSPFALPRRKRVFPNPISTLATIEVLGAAFFATFLAGAFLAAAFFTGALAAATFLAGAFGATAFGAATFLAATFLTAAFLTAFLAAFLAAAIVVFFMSLSSNLIPVVVLDSAELVVPTGTRFPRMNTYFCAIATVGCHSCVTHE